MCRKLNLFRDCSKMQRLNCKLLKKTDKYSQKAEAVKINDFPEKVIQFGEGAFLRGFMDYMINRMNEAGVFKGRVIVVQPIEQGLSEAFNGQDCLYTLVQRGMEDGGIYEKIEIITAGSRCINPYTRWQEYIACASQSELRLVVSNTTEAGIAFVDERKPEDNCPASFPAKLTAFLHERYLVFDGAHDKGMIMLPCELIERNGDQLKEIVLKLSARWLLGSGFNQWIKESNYFLNTLVDSIVPGYPKDEIDEIQTELGYEDKLLVVSEPYRLLVIEGDSRCSEELPFAAAGINAVWTDDISKYRNLKVRILNGSHTMTALAAYLCGKDTFIECMEDELVGKYIQKGISEEIVPSIELPDSIKMDYANTVISRFKNPFIKHPLLNISLNSTSKFTVRILPSLLAYSRLKKKLPDILCFSLAALIRFYMGTEVEGCALIGKRNEEVYLIRDDKNKLELMAKEWKAFKSHGDIRLLCGRLLADAEIWGVNLDGIEGLTCKVAEHFSYIMQNGIKAAIQKVTGTCEVASAQICECQPQIANSIDCH